MRRWVKTDMCAPLRCCIISQIGKIFVDAPDVSRRTGSLWGVIRVVRGKFPYAMVREQGGGRARELKSGGRKEIKRT
ncbi:hypothetical protein ACH3XW_40235 [Acanthocheilonema viteae]